MSGNNLPSLGPGCHRRLAQQSRRFLQAALLALTCTSPWTLFADETRSPVAAEAGTDASTQSAIQYRRIYVPADKIESWPRDGEKLIPVEARDFDTWIRSANDAAAGHGNHATISNAEYSGHLASDGQLHGDGKWTIVLRGEKPAFLALGDASLIIRDPHWQDAPQQPARLGMWGKSGHDPNRFGMEVARSGILAFDWHIPTRSADDQIEIPWRTPAANSVRLVLDLPEGKQPRIDGGVVLESTRRPSNDKSSGTPLRRWVIAFGHTTNANLRIVSGDRKTPEPAAQTAIRDEVRYHIGPRGLDMTTTWQLDGPTDQKREVAVAVPPGLQLSSPSADGHELPWRITRDASSPTDTALIDLPKSDGAKPLQITLNAWQPLVVGAPWRLPRLRPEGLLWSSGTFEVSIAAAYELNRLEPTDCVETGVNRLAAGEDIPEIHSFTAYTPSASVEINLAERQSDATVRAGSTLALADPDLNGRLVTQWNLSHGATHQLVGKMASGWIVEAVETVPADAMAEWFIDRHENEQQLEIQLSRAASAARNVTVIVTARLQRFSLAEPISADTMRMVKWAGARSAQHLLTFQSNDPYAVVPVGKLIEVAPETIDSNSPLLDAATENQIFDITDADKNAGLQLTLRRGQYAAHVDLEMTYENEVLRKDYVVTAEPASGPIDRMLIYSTAPLGDDVRWIDKTSNAPIAAERIIKRDVAVASLPKEGEVWQLRFSQPTARPIEISASTSSKRPERALVPLLYLPEATQQDGRIVVRSRNQNSIWPESANLQAIPLPSNGPAPTTPNGTPPVCAAFRYQPANCRDVSLSPKLWVSAISASKTAPLTARHIQLDSYFWPDGGGAHCAAYQLENHGAAELKLAMPAGTRLVSASLDGISLDVAKPTGDGQPVVFRLPAQARTTKLSLYLETRGQPLIPGRELIPPVILGDLPFLAGDWTVWLPEEYSAAGTGTSDTVPKFNWRQRLFGMFGRPNGSRPFNPFRFADAASLVNGLADGTVAGSSADSSPGQPRSSEAVENRLTPVATPAAGWRSYHESFIAGNPAPFIVLHPPAITAWSIVLLLACFASGRWIRQMRPDAFAIALAAAAALALLLPMAHADLAAGAVLGLLLSLVAGWPRRAISTEDSVHRPRLKSAVAVTLAIAFAIGLAKLSFAEPAKSDGATHSSVAQSIYRLLIPTDEKGKPSGTKYYVSEQFLRVLMAAAADATSEDGQWLLRDATFTGELIQPEQTDIVAGNWTMSFSIETLARDATIVLPLIQSEADWNATAMLDGVPLPIDWRNSGRSCAIEIPEPGRYSLAVTCVPKATAVEGRNQFELAVPPILGGKVEVRYPEAVTALSVSNASILPAPMGTPSVLNAELDQVDQFRVQWSRADKQENGAPGFSITELRWLRIKPSELDLTIKYILEGGTRRPDSIAVAFDDRWKLLTNDKITDGKNSGASSTGQHVIRIPIAAPSTDRQEISLRWRLVEPPALGTLRLPSVELTSNPATKRWLAISTDPALDCEIPDASATEGTANEFFAKWGEASTDDSPERVLSNFDPRRTNNVEIRPRETEPIVDESLNVAASLGALRVNYEAKITPGIVGAYGAELSVPANLSIGEITVTEADRSIPLRWSRAAKNRVNVFFGQQMTKAYRLVLDGTTPVDSSGKADLPHISAMATVDATQKIRLYRHDNVDVDLSGLPASTDLKADSLGPAPTRWSVRPVAVCYLESDSATTAHVVVKPNKFKVAGDSLTNLTRENGDWWVNYRCQLSVEEGNLDILRLRIPASCSSPFDVQSALPVTTEFKSLDDQTGILSVRFATTVAKGRGFDLRIRSQLKPSIGTSVSVPAIVSESLASGRRYISVPDTADSQTMTWTQTGVRPAPIPQKLRVASAASVPIGTFEVVSDPFQIASRPPVAPEVSPQIRLADTSVVVGDFGTQRITTRLILAPHGLTDCALRLPPGQTLVTIELDGRPAMIRQIDPSQWQVALSAPQLPQSLEIVSRSSVQSANGNTIELQRPALFVHDSPIAAEVSLWSFAHPLKAVMRLVKGADEVTDVEQAALRFDRLVSIAEVAKTTAAELPSPDGYNWFQPWATLLTAARAQTQHTSTVPQIEQKVDSQVTHSSEEQINQAATRLEKWLDDCRKTLVGAKSEKAPGSPATGESSKAMPVAAPATDEWSYYVAEGGNDRLALQLRPSAATTNQTRIIGLLLIVGLLFAGLWLMRRPEVSDFLCRWPHAVGIVLGIAYWAWLWPSWLGILISAASMWLALRFDWPGRSLRTEASTMLRASRSN